MLYLWHVVGCNFALLTKIPNDNCTYYSATLFIFVVILHLLYMVSQRLHNVTWCGLNSLPKPNHL